ncbi:MAG TPA: polysaccharide ABC transporter ATP-binding protein [Candidatus Acidoferrales bacterium]
MSEPVIRVERIGKRYRLGEGLRHTALRNVIGDALRAPLRLLTGSSHAPNNGPGAGSPAINARARAGMATNGSSRFIWALKDVNFEVQRGEVVGLIGRNGAGKSTLLKILARITRPTEGRAEIHGRVGSLLEVGTGFHPELTGRENVYMSGAILGMRKAEIDRKFDEIVAFSEVERFLDTPLKHYSSGMQMRLAFAVAAHLEPEILLVDEVLAVGDLQFQKKCLGKMGEVAKTGRTIAFVSHQINQIRRLCPRVLWVDGGGIRMDGAAHEVLAGYESAMSAGDGSKNPQPRAGTRAQFLRWQIGGSRADQLHVLSSMDPVTVQFWVELAQPVINGEHGVALFNADRQLMWARAAQSLALRPGVHVFSHTFPTLPLRPGAYQWQVSLWDNSAMLDLWDCLPEMTIATEIHQHHMDQWNGVLNIPTKFSHQEGRGGYR